jgi:prophage antirepressor-like protein
MPVPSSLIAGSGRGMAQAILISEPGLYKLIAKSDKPQAKAFDRWVRHEVLPAIAKTGGDHLITRQVSAKENP